MALYQLYGEARFTHASSSYDYQLVLSEELNRRVSLGAIAMGTGKTARDFTAAESYLRSHVSDTLADWACAQGNGTDTIWQDWLRFSDIPIEAMVEGTDGTVPDARYNWGRAVKEGCQIRIRRVSRVSKLVQHALEVTKRVSVALACFACSIRRVEVFFLNGENRDVTGGRLC